MVVWMELFEEENSWSVLLCRLFLQKKVPGNKSVQNYSGAGNLRITKVIEWEKNRSHLWRNATRILSQENCRFVAIWEWFRCWRTWLLREEFFSSLFKLFVILSDSEESRKREANGFFDFTSFVSEWQARCWANPLGLAVSPLSRVNIKAPSWERGGWGRFETHKILRSLSSLRMTKLHILGYQIF